MNWSPYSLFLQDSSLLISLNGMCKVSYPFEVSDLAHLTSKVFIYVLRYICVS